MPPQIQAGPRSGEVQRCEKRFLVIDDDIIFLAVAEAVISTLGTHRVDVANNGVVGLQLASQCGSAIDVIILDLNMPKLDGLGFLRALSEAGFAGSIIISSGEADAVVRAARRMGELLGLRILGALSKPLKADALRDMLADNDGARPRLGGVPPQSSTAAMETADLLVYFQPQYDIQTGAILGFEALARARLSDGAIKGPDFVFAGITSVEEFHKITVAVCRNAFAHLHAWRADSRFPGSVSINVDVALIEMTDFSEAVVRLAAEADVPTEKIVLELTETTLASDVSRLLEGLTRLRMAGFCLSVDDFGTGGSNFDLLALCPFTELKIDRTIVAAAPHDATAHRFLKFCCEAARDLDLTVVAEGIETEEELRLAVSAGVGVAQGYLFSRPLPPTDIAELFRSGRRWMKVSPDQISRFAGTAR